MSDTRTLYIERVLTELANGMAPQASAVTAALAELRALQAQLQTRAQAPAPRRYWP